MNINKLIKKNKKLLYKILFVLLVLFIIYIIYEFSFNKIENLGVGADFSDAVRSVQAHIRGTTGKVCGDIETRGACDAKRRCVYRQTAYPKQCVPELRGEMIQPEYEDYLVWLQEMLDYWGGTYDDWMKARLPPVGLPNYLQNINPWCGGSIDAVGGVRNSDGYAETNMPRHEKSKLGKGCHSSADAAAAAAAAAVGDASTYCATTGSARTDSGALCALNTAKTACVNETGDCKFRPIIDFHKPHKPKPELQVLNERLREDSQSRYVAGEQYNQGNEKYWDKMAEGLESARLALWRRSGGERSVEKDRLIADIEATLEAVNISKKQVVDAQIAADAYVVKTPENWREGYVKFVENNDYIPDMSSNYWQEIEGRYDGIDYIKREVAGLHDSKKRAYPTKDQEKNYIQYIGPIQQAQPNQDYIAVLYRRPFNLLGQAQEPEPGEGEGDIPGLPNQNQPDTVWNPQSMRTGMLNPPAPVQHMGTAGVGWDLVFSALTGA